MKHYELNSRIEYYVFRDGRRVRRIGYVKKRCKILFLAYYIVCTADKLHEVDFVRPQQILGLAPKKDYKSPNTDNDAD